MNQVIYIRFYKSDNDHFECLVMYWFLSFFVSFCISFLVSLKYGILRRLKCVLLEMS
jgi:hypothetical protein